jgi:hypothetical protein
LFLPWLKGIWFPYSTGAWSIITRGGGAWRRRAVWSGCTTACVVVEGGNGRQDPTVTRLQFLEKELVTELKEGNGVRSGKSAATLSMPLSRPLRTFHTRALSVTGASTLARASWMNFCSRK